MTALRFIAVLVGLVSELAYCKVISLPLALASQSKHVLTGYNNEMQPVDIEVQAVRTELLSHLGQQVLHEVPNIPLHDIWDDIYIFNISVGNPAQSFRVQVSTDSATTWITGDGCHTAACEPHSKYVSGDSSTYRRDGLEFRSHSDFGIADGFMSIDTLEIVNLTVSDQAFAEVLDVDPFWFRYAHFDGVLGLGLADWPPSGRLPLIENMLARDQLDQPIASLYFTLGNTSRDSRLILGGVDTQLFKGPLTRLPLRDNSTHWDINLDSMRIGNVSFEPKGWHVRFDSMKFSIGVPSYLRDILDILIGPYQGLCERRSILPDLTFRLGGNDFSFTPKHYIAWIAEDECVPAFSVNDHDVTGSKRIDLGMPFLQQWYSSYDYERRTVSLAEAVHH